jgi:outer membrane protein assembly factor BamD (BamD/ComL family)
MKRAVVLLIFAAFFAVAGTFASDKVEMIDGYQNALKAAGEKNQDILIKFYTDWCGWCKRLDSVTYRHPDVIALTDNIVFARVNAEKDTLIAQRYGIAGYPTIVLTKPDGTEIDRIYGYREGPEFASMVNDYLAGKNTLDDYLQRAEQNPSSELYYAIADKYMGRKQYDNAETYYRQILKADPANKEGYSDSAVLSLADMKVRDKEYAAAIDMFQKLIQTYPESDLVDNAAFNVAKTQRRAEKFDEAIASFKSFIDTYPQSDLVEQADLYIPFCYNLKGEKEKAVELYRAFLEKYPKSDDKNWVNKQIDQILNPPEEEKGS